MQAYLWLAADLRAALTFTPAAWRRASSILIVACLTWAMALSPARAPEWTALALAGTLVASAELYRIATPQGAGARIAATGRLAVVWLLTLAFFMVLASLLFVVFLASGYAVAFAGRGFDASDVRTWAPAIDERGRVVLGAVAALGIGLVSWAMTRVALAPAATVAAGRVLMLNTWPLTRRIGWVLVCARLAIGLPAAGVAALALGEAHVSGAAERPGAWMLSALSGLIIGGVWLPLNNGLMTYIYHRRANL